MPTESHISIHYQLTCGDFDRLSKKRSLPDHPTLGHPEYALRNPRHVEGFLCGLLLTGGFAVLLGFVLWNKLTQHGAWVLIPLVLAGEAAVWGLFQLYRACVFRAWQNAGFFDERWVSLTHDGVVLNEPHAGIRRFPWAAIPGASIDEDHVTLALSPRPPAEWPASSVLFIPRTGFTDSAEAESFAAFAQTQSAEAKLRGPTAETSETDPAQERSINVSYQLEKADFDRLYKQSWNVISYRRFREILAIALLAELILVSLFLPPVGPGGWKEFVGFALSLTTQYVTLIWLIHWWGRRVWRRSGFFEPQTVVLSPAGLSVRCRKGGEWWLTWDQVEGTARDAHGVVVRIPSRRIPLTIPLQGFASDKDADAFVAAAEQWRGAWSEPENPQTLHSRKVRDNTRQSA